MSLRLGQRNNWFRQTSPQDGNKLHRDEWINKLVTGIIKKKVGINSECIIKEKHGKLYVYSLIHKIQHKKRNRILRLNILKKRNSTNMFLRNTLAPSGVSTKQGRFERLCSLLRFTKSKSLRTRILLREISIFIENLIKLTLKENYEVEVRWVEVSSIKHSSYMIGNWIEKSLNQDEKTINERKVLWALYKN